ncbi:hypothetical protein TNCV_4951141 [Trichonephila clavipes]|nr:hypothetical protein TNCV_4951141 [Trichonephila clavipes]
MNVLQYILCCCCFLCHLISTASDPGPRNSSWQGAGSTSVVGRSLEHYTGGSTILLCSTTILRDNTLGGQGSPNSFPLTPTSREDLRLYVYLAYSHAAKALSIYMSSPVFEPRLCGTALASIKRETHYIWSYNDNVLNNDDRTRKKEDLNEKGTKVLEEKSMKTTSPEEISVCDLCTNFEMLLKNKPNSSFSFFH